MDGAPLLGVRVMVGKIPSCLDDDFLERLLSACGAVKEWKRVVDPVTKASKPYGFCTWSSPQGALCALRLIHGLAVEDGVLELKPGKASEQQMDAWLAEGNEFREIDAEEARNRVQSVLETRAALPQRTREMLRQEMERAEKRRKHQPSKDHDVSAKEAMKDVQNRRKREDRARERERRVQERVQQEARAVELERQWEERERQNERTRARLAREQRGEVGADYTAAAAAGEPLSIAARRARVAATARDRERERREDFEARQSRLIFSGSAPLLQAVAASASENASSTGSLPSVSSKPSLFATQEEEDQEELTAQQQQQMQARMLFVPTDTLYRRKLTPAEVEEIVQSIPKDPASLYAHAIDWAFLQVVGALEGGASRPVQEFVAKSITELVGEMPDMVEFIMTLLRKGVKPEDLETKMRMVLQDDAPTFVFKLWRFLAYQVKAEQRQRQ